MFIDREKRRDVTRAIPELQGALGEGSGVIVFPEGTSSPGSKVLPFHASLLQVPISLAMPTPLVLSGVRHSRSVTTGILVRMLVG